LGFREAPGDDHLCSGCLTEERYFTKARAIALYEGLMAEAISRFKYQRDSRLAKPLGTLLAEYQDPEFLFAEFDLMLAVPLHPQRLRQRGFNQSILLARRLSRTHSIPLDLKSLQRTRQTQPQTHLSGSERQKNIRGAFEVRKPEVISGKHVLLIDDVFTTGATVQECSKVLLKAGAKEVDVLTLARAL
jgi:ComF family protein